MQPLRIGCIAISGGGSCFIISYLILNVSLGFKKGKQRFEEWHLWLLEIYFWLNDGHTSNKYQKLEDKFSMDNRIDDV